MKTTIYSTSLLFVFYLAIIYVLFLFIIPDSNLYAISIDYITDRPYYSVRSELLSPGTLQLENGYTYKRENNISEHSVGEMLLRLGLFRVLEFRMGMNSIKVSEYQNSDNVDSTGKDDLKIGFKFRISRSKSTFNLFRPETSFLFEAYLPSGSEEYREDTVQPVGKLALAWPLDYWIDFSINGGYAYLSENMNQFHQYSLSTVLTTYPFRNTSLYVEFYSLWPERQDETNSSYIDLGCSVRIINRLQFDMAGGKSFNSNRDEYYVSGGFTVRFLHVY